MPQVRLQVGVGAHHVAGLFPGAGELGQLLGPQRPGSVWAAGSQELSWHECAVPGQRLGGLKVLVLLL